MHKVGTRPPSLIYSLLDNADASQRKHWSQFFISSLIILHRNYSSTIQ